MLRMDRVHVIRYKHFTEGQSIRRIARDMKISRNTVRKYVYERSEPVRKEETARPRPVLESVQSRIEELHASWSTRTTDKQRITGSRIHQELVEEGYQVGVTTVREYLAERRRREAEVFVPLVYVPGDCGQVDFFEVTVEIEGRRVKVWKFLMRLMYSGRDFVWLYERCNQIAFLDAHVRAFLHFGGVSARLIYDNLTEAVKRRLGMRGERVLTDRFLALASHYLFEPCFARPGEGHDKGGVEGRGKTLRLQHLTPIPRGRTLEEIAASLLQEVDRTAERRRDREGRTVAARFSEEKEYLRSLPERQFEARGVEPVVISRQALVRVEGADYSVPGHWHSLQAMAYVGVSDIRLECRGESITVAKVARGRRYVQYRHYYDELAKKPQAVRQVAPELLPQLGEPYGKLWELLSARYGPREAARVVAKLIGAICEHGQQVVTDSLRAVLDHRSAAPPVVATVPDRVAVPAALAGYAVHSGSVAAYDALLQEPGDE